ncbi:MAG: hypothetical protein KDK12_02015 [Rhodobacteraceae bacterium]|nr:hypothetical protein [Paracoccaceae bacterium]
MTARQPAQGAFRSPARRRLLAAARRRRNYPLRYLLIGGVAVLLAMVAAAIANQTLPKGFPFALFYLAHDHIWLTLRGYLWTAQFPYALIWAVPTLIALTVVAVEALSPAGVRGLHRALLLRLMARWINPIRRAAPRPDMLPRRWLESTFTEQTGWGAFAQRVAIERRQAAWFVLREAQLAGQPLPAKERQTLLVATGWWLRLDPESPRAAIAALEAVALCGRDGGDQLATILDGLLASVEGAELAPDLGIVRATLRYLAFERKDASRIAVLDGAMNRLNAHHSPGAFGAVAIAADAILSGAMAQQRIGVVARDWFRLFARLRMDRSTTTDSTGVGALVQDVMNLCDIAFWASHAEEASRRREAFGDPLFRLWASPATDAEHFARQGAL